MKEIELVERKEEYFLEDEYYEYDSKPHTHLLKGKIPSNYRVVYENNTKKYIGTSITTAYIYDENYNLVDILTAKLSILRKKDYLCMLYSNTAELILKGFNYSVTDDDEYIIYNIEVYLDSSVSVFAIPRVICGRTTYSISIHFINNTDETIHINNLYINDCVENIDIEDLKNNVIIDNIIVDPNNEYLIYKNGLLFNTDVKTSISYISNDIEELKLPRNVKCICNMNGFKYRRNIKSFTLNSSIKDIPDNCFEGWESLHELIIPESVKEIGDYAFKGVGGKKGLKLILPEHEKRRMTVGFNTFSGFKPITNKEDNCEYIGSENNKYQVFYRNTKKNSVINPKEGNRLILVKASGDPITIYVPNSTKSISQIGDDDYLFFKEIHFKNYKSLFRVCINKQYRNVFGDEDYFGFKTDVFVNDHLIGGKLYIPDEIKYIQRNFFNCYDHITEIEFSDTRRRIGKNAFSEMENLRKITIGYGLYAELDFENNNGLFNYLKLDEVIFKDNANFFPYNSFKRTTIKKLYLPESFNKLGYLLNHGCIKVDEIIQPGKNYVVTDDFISEGNTIKHLFNYQNAVIPYGITSIDDYAMSDYSIKSDDDIDNVIRIGALTLPDTIKHIGKQKGNLVRMLFCDSKEVIELAKKAFGKVGLILSIKDKNDISLEDLDDYDDY